MSDTIAVTESVVEEVVLTLFEGLGYSVLNGPTMAPEQPTAERASFADVILLDRLRAALVRINPTIPADAIEEALRKATRVETPAPEENNRRFHKLLTEGIDVEFRRTDNTVTADKVWLIDWVNPDNNDWLVVNQFTVSEDRHTRRPDVVVFINGIPLSVIELKSPTEENATLRTAFNQLQTYKKELPNLFRTNALLVVSDGLGEEKVPGTFVEPGPFHARALARDELGRHVEAFADWQQALKLDAQKTLGIHLGHARALARIG